MKPFFIIFFVLLVSLIDELIERERKKSLMFSWITASELLTWVKLFSNKVANNTSGHLFENSFSPSSSFDTHVPSLPFPSYTKFWAENETSFCRIHYECETKKPAGVQGGKKHFYDSAFEFTSY